MGKITNMTVKGQVTIPKAIRDGLGLLPNAPVEIEWDGGDMATIRRPVQDRNARRAEIKRKLDAAAEAYAHLRTGRDTDEIMLDIRGDDPFPP